MKRFDIDKIFSLFVDEYIKKGYVINTDSMNGNQGEIAKVDLWKGDELIRVVLSRGYETRYLSTNTLCMVVGKYTKPIIPGWTVWTGDFEDIERHVFWELSKNWYVGDEEFAKKCLNKREARWRNTYSHFDRLALGGYICLPDSARKVILNRVRNLPKCKSVKLSDIGEVWRERKDGVMIYYATVRKETQKFAEVKIA